jgi:NADH-quinone oxidoreductase subunit L
MNEFIYQAWLCWIFPILGALLTPILAKINSKARDYGAILFSLLAMISTISLIPLLFEHGIHWPINNQLDWIRIPNAPILNELKVGILLDPLSIIMANVVAIISFLIMVYSLAYMHGDPGLTRYWFFMNFFIGNMLLLVMSDNLIQMLFGWEGVGLCSYALIGFWYKDSEKDWLKCWVGEKPEAYPPSHCGMKAFITTRIGDISMLIGMFMILAFSGTLNFIELQEGAINKVPMYILIPATILLFGGPVGKSAQLPLMEWLPDAMAGPTTVSALIHAATMVKAGVYLVGRIFPIIYKATWIGGSPNDLIIFFYVVAWIGIITAFIAGSQAIVSKEVKKVLAYSTVSQLGYMMTALGVAGLTADFIIGYVAGIFHLMSHAMFKAALFLSAGAIIHACESRFMTDMGGLRKNMPITFWFTLLAAFSLMGFPFLFSGFWSKDMILESTLLANQYLIFILAAISAIITSFYSIRMIGIVFFGEKSHHLEELEKEGHHIHEAPKIMWVPYALLVCGTILFGLIGPFAKSWLEETFHEYLGETIIFSKFGSTISEEILSLIVPITSVIALAIGAIPSYFIYVKRSIDIKGIMERRPFLNSIKEFLYNRYYINRFYYNFFVYPLIDLSKAIWRKIELNIIDRFNYVLANIVVSFSKWSLKVIELSGIDNFNYILARAGAAFCNKFRKTHTGILNYNLMGIMIGMFIILLIIKIMII